ncbi:flagellin Hag [Clostridium estertheticum]|uniref:flagellin Hag n=1 Tax=Clostridium estertheticum TaxID=238834 RepID=UPI001C7E07B8|nr:flagellin Hag [Clostridium estertheticum]MBX4262480.1 flagellin Hag [Clostridium estertheticum]MCB2356277.1 flagellin Hag [Clostridium estertheticum]WAG42762.1 flagellin Hag [Clostridium estertheticum]WLC68909.1 flagellin Hag [Clostridium estertheticum]
MIINHNMGALNANRNMNINSGAASKSMEKLSSGLRINKAGDDAAGLAISEKMRGQIRGLDQASANAQDGISMIGTGEGALNETTSILQRMRELAVQGSNDTNTTEDRTQIQKEMNQLTSETSRIGNNTEFNGQKLLNGTGGASVAAAGATVASSSFTFQIGANQGQQFTASINDMRSKALGIAGTGLAGTAGTGGAKFVAVSTGNVLSDVSATATPEYALDISTATLATAAIKVLDKATALVSGERAKLGAYSNRLDHTIANLGTSSENLTSAESRIRDVDMAKEMSTFSKNNILNQAAQAMLVQANQQPQQVLALLR